LDKGGIVINIIYHIVHSHRTGEVGVRVETSHPFYLSFPSPSLTPSSHGMVGFSFAVCIEAPPRPPLTSSQILYTTVSISIDGAEMQTDEHYGKPELLEVRQIKREKVKRERLYSWSFKLPSKRTNRFGKHFYSSFEVFIPEPVEGDVLVSDNGSSVFIKVQNGYKYLIENMDLAVFCESPLIRMMEDDDKRELLGKANEANLRIQDMARVVGNRLTGGG
jgi:hypothetical protein